MKNDEETENTAPIEKPRALKEEGVREAGTPAREADLPPATSAPATAVQKSAEDDAAVVSLDTFIQLFQKSERLRTPSTAGFRSHARSRRLTSRTMTEWRTAYDAFMSRPVR